MRSIVTAICGVVIAAVLIAAGLVVAVPGVGPEPPQAGSEAERQGTRAERFFRVEWSAAARGADQSPVLRYVYNEYCAGAVDLPRPSNQLPAGPGPGCRLLQ